MTNKLNSTLLTAAGLALLAAAAYGQVRLAANIPFSFRTNAGVHAAGQYSVVRQGEITLLQNLQTGQSAMLGIGVPDGGSRPESPRLVFTCGSESGCALTGVHAGDGRAWRFNAPKLKPSEEARVKVVYLGSREAE